MKLKTGALIIILLAIAGITACKGETKKSDQEKIEESVRTYLFLGDSIEVTTVISDTIHVEELNGMLSTTEENIRLIQQDIDTLGTMMDTLAYKMQADGEEIPRDFVQTLSPNQQIFCQYQLKYTKLEFQKRQFSQTNRILLHLKRSVWANIAGFEVEVRYKLGENDVETLVLMDADFNVVD